MRLRVLELPTQPVPLNQGPGDGSTVTYRLGEPNFVLVLDEVDERTEQNMSAVTVETWRKVSGARGVLMFRDRVDLPAAD